MGQQVRPDPWEIPAYWGLGSEHGPGFFPMHSMLLDPVRRPAGNIAQQAAIAARERHHHHPQTKPRIFTSTDARNKNRRAAALVAERRLGGQAVPELGREMAAFLGNEPPVPASARPTQRSRFAGWHLPRERSKKTHTIYTNNPQQSVRNATQRVTPLADGDAAAATAIADEIAAMHARPFAELPFSSGGRRRRRQSRRRRRRRRKSRHKTRRRRRKR